MRTATTNTCKCGCGEMVERDFAPGHDLRAVMDRVKQFGGAAAFIEWFDTALLEKTK